MEYYSLYTAPEIPVLLDPNIEFSTPKSYGQYLLNKKRRNK